MYTLASSEDEELASAAEVRRVRSITGFWTQEGFNAAKAGIQRYEEIVPDERGDSEICESEEEIRVSYCTRPKQSTRNWNFETD
jgi:hypothetical protein